MFFPIGSSPAAIAIGHSREVPGVTVSLSGAGGRCIQTDGQPHRVHLCHKATLIEIAGIRHSFDPDVHDNRSLRPFLFDSTTDADQFLSILALLPHPLPFAAILRPLTASTFGLETFCLNARVKNGRLSSNSRYPPSTSYPATIIQSWFKVLVFSIKPQCIRDYSLLIKTTCIHC